MIKSLVVQTKPLLADSKSDFNLIGSFMDSDILAYDDLYHPRLLEGTMTHCLSRGLIYFVKHCLRRDGTGNTIQQKFGNILHVHFRDDPPLLQLKCAVAHLLHMFHIAPISPSDICHVSHGSILPVFVHWELFILTVVLTSTPWRERASVVRESHAHTNSVAGDGAIKSNWRTCYFSAKRRYGKPKRSPQTKLSAPLKLK